MGGQEKGRESRLGGGGERSFRDTLFWEGTVGLKGWLLSAQSVNNLLE